MLLNSNEKTYLLSLARHTIKQYFTPGLEDLPDSYFDVMKQKNGAFVTLTSNGRLRGCIGYIIGEQPLFKTIKH